MLHRVTMELSSRCAVELDYQGEFSNACAALLMRPPLLNSLAETTAHRDRDDLDRAVAQLLFDYLDKHAVTVLRLIPDGAIRRVQRRIRIDGDGAEAPPVFAKLSTLPALADFPAWQECAMAQTIVTSAAAGGRLLCVFPIRGEREAVGMLEVETSATLSAHEVDLVLGILTILKNHLALLDYGEIDTLTGLLNRKTFEGQFEKLRRRVHDPMQRPETHAAEEPSWLGLVDIDHFKSINDGYGHLFGDEVLLLVSHVMRRSFRGADQLFRFGGEEFVILLEHASEPGAAIAFERFREAVEQYAFPQVGRVTVSLGYTRVDARDVPTLCVERADAALYYMKSHGRNGVRNCESLILTGEICVQQQSDDVELF